MFQLFPDDEPVEIPKLLQPWQIHSPAFVHPSQTSQDAAFAILPKQGSLQERVLKAIEIHGGLTDQEIADITGLSPNTARPRRIELTNAGVIKDGGTRLTKAGRKAVVWVLTN